MASRESKKGFVLHPVLFALYPVLFLYSHNIEEVLFSDTLNATGVILGGMVVLWGVFYLWHRNLSKAGLLASWCIILFFMYGAVYEVFCDLGWRGWHVGKYKIGANTYWLPVWTVIWATGILLITRNRRSLRPVTRIANVVAAVLVGFTLIPIGRAAFSSVADPLVVPPVAPTGVPPVDSISRPEKLPDIYYIIPDGYVRSDILERDYPHGNADFIDYLLNKGFYVANRSRSNYTRTFISITATLNMDYMNRLGTYGNTRRAIKVARHLYRNNFVFRALKEFDYEIISFPTGWAFTDLADANVGRYVSDSWRLQELENELLDMTPLGTINQIASVRTQKTREQILFPLNYIEQQSGGNKPMFVLAHIVCPHPPFVFGAHGEPIITEYSIGGVPDPEDNVAIARYKQQYADQAAYLNQQLMKVIDHLLSRPGDKPIIILQADHGDRYMIGDSWPGDSDPYLPFANLNAVYFPDGDYFSLYDSFSGVNTFRLIFRKYFAVECELLPDRCYFRNGRKGFNFIAARDYLKNRENVSVSYPR